MKRILLSFLPFLLLGTAVWWMSANVVWLGDDLDYKYMMKGELWQSWGKIKTAKAFFESQWIHYRHVNGRFVAHALVQLFNARLGQQAFAVCNAIVYSLFAMFMAKGGGIRLKDNSGGIISIVCVSVICFITKMMPTCQIGYIWAMAANLAWLMLFFRKGKPSWWLTGLMILFGLVVGNWQESISIGVCGGLGIWWIYQTADSRKNNGCRFDWRRSWMLAGYVIGTASNCLAPSTIGRVSDLVMPLTDRLLIASYSFPAVLLLMISVIFVSRRHSRLRMWEFRNSDGGIPTGVLTSGMFFLLAFNVAIGVYSNRQLFGANLFAAILAFRILPCHRFGWVLNTLASAAVLAYWCLMVHGILEVRGQYDEIASLHAESPDGSVYFDRTRVMTLGFPLRAKYYEDILGQFDNDLHHSLMKDFKHVRKGKTLKLKPTAQLREETVESFAPGHYTVVMKEPPKGEAPREVIVYGHYPVFGIKGKPRIIQVTRYANRSKAFGAAVIIPEFPFFIADSVAIIKN